MATRNSIKFSTIHKRSQCLNFQIVDESTKMDSRKLYENLASIMERSKTGKEAGTQHALKSYLESLCNSENLNRDYWSLLEIVSRFNKIDSNISDNIIYEFTDRIIPYMENLNSIVECLNDYELDDSQKNSIIGAVSLYNAADRIIKNNDMLSKRYHIENLISRYRASGLKYFVDSCASFVDTYNAPNYQKLNITLEECTYLLEKNGIKENRADIAKYAMEYFLTVEATVTNKSISNYRRTITESYILEESDIDQIGYIFKDDIKVDSVNSGIEKFLLSDKDSDSISNMITDIISNASKEDIVCNSDKILSTFWNIAKHEVLESDDIIYSEAIRLTNFISCNEEYSVFAKEDIDNIIESLENNKKEVTLSGNYNSNYAKAGDNFIKNAIEPCLEALRETESIIYPKANIDTINYLNEDTNIIPLNEFKLFKFHNLVRAAFNLDKFLKVKEKKFYTNTKIKVNKLTRKAKSVLFGETTSFEEIKENILCYVGEDHKADICIKQYPCDESDMVFVGEFLNGVCSEFNDLLVSQSETCRAYYIINPGIAEIRIKESSTVELEDNSEIYSNLDSSIDIYFEMLHQVGNATDIIGNINTDSIEQMICNIANCKEFTMERFKLSLECMSLIGIDNELVSLFGSRFNDYHFNYTIDNGVIDESYIKLAGQEREVSKLISEYKIEEGVDFEDKVKCFGYLAELLEVYSYPSSDDDDEDDEDENETSSKKEDTKKEEKKDTRKPSEIFKDEVKSIDDIKIPTDAPKDGYKGGLNLAGIKLGLNGIKTKFKEMSTKEKELSRNADTTTRTFVKAMKDALVSDRREAIIKGSVIPSFSRCLKAALALFLVSKISIGVAVIVALGGFALSKKLTKQERLLLLDEIETELEVVDKELALADSNNQINKYRELLKYKKNLQRQYQRIKYNIRIGKDILPGSSAGMREH